jgi:hypothetical protein
VGGQGEKGAPGGDGRSGGSPASVEDVQGSVNAAPETAMADGNVTAQEGGATSSSASRVGGQSVMSSRSRAQVEGSAGPQTMAAFDVGNSADESPEAITVEGDGPIGASGSASVPESGGGETIVAEVAPTPVGADSGGSSVGEPAVVEPVEVGKVGAAAPEAASGSTAASGGTGVTADAPVGASGALKEGSLGGVVPAGEEGSRRKGRSDDRSLGEKISGIHNTAAQVHQHLPEDSATVSAPTLNIQHGE